MGPSGDDGFPGRSGKTQDPPATSGHLGGRSGLPSVSGEGSRWRAGVSFRVSEAAACATPALNTRPHIISPRRSVHTSIIATSLPIQLVVFATSFVLAARCVPARSAPSHLALFRLNKTSASLENSYTHVTSAVYALAYGIRVVLRPSHPMCAPAAFLVACMMSLSSPASSSISKAWL